MILIIGPSAIVDLFSLKRFSKHIDHFKIGGTNGSPGGNSGKFKLESEAKSKFKLVNSPGIGGSHSFEFEECPPLCKRPLDSQVQNQKD